MRSVRKILVVGGNGFIGSAVCKAALTRGIQVTSVSSSGKPYRTAKGHAPAWTADVDWQKGDAFHPGTFKHIFPHVDGVVHTLGILIEDGNYKQAVEDGNIPQLLSSLFRGITQSSSNPLKKEMSSGLTYGAMNRDSALLVCNEFVSSPLTPGSDDPNNPRPFVYISAEDIFRPFIPSGYIETKRQAEQGIEDIMAMNPRFRGVYIRPSLVYHAHRRLLTTAAAALCDLSATLHRKSPQGMPTPSGILRSLGSTGLFGGGGGGDLHGSPLHSIADALVIPPIHVDNVADAIFAALDSRNGVKGVVGVRRMRELIGWHM